MLGLALLLYSISARDPLAPPSLAFWLHLVMVGIALVVDAVMLAVMLTGYVQRRPDSADRGGMGAQIDAFDAASVAVPRPEPTPSRAALTLRTDFAAHTSEMAARALDAPVAPFRQGRLWP